MAETVLVAETVLEQHYRDRVESVRRIAGADSGNGVHTWQFYVDLTSLCVQLSVSGRELLAEEYRRIFKEHDRSLGWFRERRIAIENLSHNYVNLAESVRAAAVEACKTTGSPRANDLIAVLDDAIRTFVAATRDVLDRWIVGTDEETAAAAAAAARGEGIDIVEAFAEIAGVDGATWLQRIEEYKANPPA